MQANPASRPRALCRLCSSLVPALHLPPRPEAPPRILQLTHNGVTYLLTRHNPRLYSYQILTSSESETPPSATGDNANLDPPPGLFTPPGPAALGGQAYEHDTSIPAPNEHPST
ncbi:hypothetical protein A4X13_0g9633 [Tilletia indica]|uniref:Uncharacterized protein n=1 Tax=Tilletia indica TaxID=43049 RepID=A0A177T6Q7_9BASI|nr:hypothetical protein A4X13_0g9633 [Tilletia indica]